jgi:hypothetical protein
LYTNVYVVPLTVRVPWTVTGAAVNGGVAGWVAVIVAVPLAPSLIRRVPLLMSAMAGLLMEKVAPVTGIL